MIWFFLAAVAVIPVGTRLLIGTVIPGFHEYEAIFLYGSDIVMLLLLCLAWRRHHLRARELFRGSGGLFLVVMLIAAGAAAVTAPSAWLAVYGIGRLALLMLFAFAIGALAGKKQLLQAVLAVISIMTLLQAGIAISQFKLQGSVGLSKFGEPQLLTYAGSTSTISAEGGRVLRVYGTFPHPNVLAAFLVLGILSLAYWYLWCEQEIRLSFRATTRNPVSRWTSREYLRVLNSYLKHRYFYLRLATAAAMFVVLLALALTFSRTGWFAGVVGMLCLALLTLRSKMHDGRAAHGAVLRLLLMVAVCAAAVYLLFAPLIGPRVEVRTTEPAVSERLTYTDIGLQLVGDSFGGVGAGNQVLYSVNHNLYQERGLTNVWDWEPVHNLYLLVASELGLLGLLSFLAFLGMVTWQLVRQQATLESAVVLALLAAMLVAGLFDHYLWDLQPGRLMLWLVIGLALSQRKPPG